MNTIKKSDLIDQYKELHLSHPHYGSSMWLAPFIERLCSHYALHSVLDFGCGKGALVKRLLKSGLTVAGYDPAVESYHKCPEGQFDLVMANDVLEHLDPESYSAELTSISNYSAKVIFLRISCRAAFYHLPDGRNCHTILLRPGLWKKILCDSWPDFQLEESQFDWLDRSLTLIFAHKSQPRLNSDLLPTMKLALRKRISLAAHLLKCWTLSTQHRNS